MTSKPIGSDSSSYSQAQAELELVQALLQANEAAYPWNPADPNAESYFTQMEQAFDLTAWSEDEVAPRSQKFFSFLNQLWTPVSLTQKFSARVPQALLNQIAQHAQRIVASNLSLANQLIQCVQDVLPNWGEEDLQILARPLAYAMRGNETEAIESTLTAVRAVEWTELSEIEQARLSLAVARYALAQLDSDR